MIELTPVESHQIAGIGYEPETETLAVQFWRCKSKERSVPGHVYYYDNVPAELHARFMAAESKGKFFGAEIKNNPRYPFERQPDPVAEPIAEPLRDGKTLSQTL